MGDSVSGNPKRADLGETEERPGYKTSLQQGAGNLNMKRLLLIKRKLNLSHEEI